ncbi:type II restriction endonuclease [Helicobacter vulpis]|uniref:type II restriction endonuclease n=1 Tax=Helicobacter vulpis TaxID=2316076 RepID=UPI001F2668BD|nr:type II restriction endonuclease [Helicobacter vulpis]
MDLRYVNGTQMRRNTKNHLDAYFTKPEIAQKLLTKAKEVISQYEALDKYTWLEPSVGDGCFYTLLPEAKIGIDINSSKFDIIQANYLDFTLPSKPLIVIGNPPFGHRGVLALEFINHSRTARKGLSNNSFQFNLKFSIAL